MEYACVENKELIVTGDFNCNWVAKPGYKETKGFVYRQLKDLKVKKATGLDEIPARLLTDSAVVITNAITFIVNLSLSSGVVPDGWKQARVVPLYKSGGREVMYNYRPISILSVISKIAERAI